MEPDPWEGVAKSGATAISPRGKNSIERLIRVPDLDRQTARAYSAQLVVDLTRCAWLASGACEVGDPSERVRERLAGPERQPPVAPDRIGGLFLLSTPC